LVGLPAASFSAKKGHHHQKVAAVPVLAAVSLAHPDHHHNRDLKNHNPQYKVNDDHQNDQNERPPHDPNDLAQDYHVKRNPDKNPHNYPSSFLLS
jgi:hypothetical protein